MRPERSRLPLRVSLLYVPVNTMFRRGVPTRCSDTVFWHDVLTRPHGGQNPLTHVADIRTRPHDYLTSCAASHWSASSRGQRSVVQPPPNLLPLPRHEDKKNLLSWLGRLSGRKKNPEPMREKVTPNHSLGRPFISTAFSSWLFQSEENTHTHSHTQNRHKSNSGCFGSDPANGEQREWD